MSDRLSWKGVVIGAVVGAAIGFVAGSLAALQFLNHEERVLTQRAMARRAAGSVTSRPTLPDATLAPPERALGFDYRVPTTTADGTRLDLGTFKGKVLVANVWATWCVPCLAEMPALEGLAARFHGDPRFAFVLISKDTRDNLERFLATHGKPTIPIALLGPGVNLPGAESIVPVTLIVAPDGSVRVREPGAANWNSDRVVTFIRSLSAQPS